MYPEIQQALANRSIVYQLITYSPPWSGASGTVDSLTYSISASRSYDLTIVLTFDAHLNRFRFSDTWQVDLVNGLVAEGTKVVVVSLKSPADILDFPEISTYLATFGTTRGQCIGLAEVLVGNTEPFGINPVPAMIDP